MNFVMFKPIIQKQNKTVDSIHYLEYDEIGSTGLKTRTVTLDDQENGH